MSNIYCAQGTTLSEQYHDVGVLFGHNIRESVLAIGKKKSKKAQIRREVAKYVLSHISTLPKCWEFLECLSAWSSGADITTEQAMWLLADNLSGCQTMILRYGSGVALLHTEEEFIDAHNIKLHLGNPHTIEFHDGVRTAKTLVYNDLLPGSGLFSWKQDMMVAVDSLFLREDGIDLVKRPILANIVSWMVWRMEARDLSPEMIVKLVHELGELVDGYAINVVCRKGETISGFKVSLMRSEVRVERLGMEVGSYLRQVNIVEPNYSGLHYPLPPRQIWKGGWGYFNKRLSRMDYHVDKYRKYIKQRLNPEEVEVVHRIIQHTIFGKLRRSYVNPDLGAVCIGLLDEGGLSVSCKLHNNQPIKELEYIDLIPSGL